MAKNRTGVLTHPSAIVQRTGISKSVAFDRWRHWPIQRAAITLAMLSFLVFVNFFMQVLPFHFHFQLGWAVYATQRLRPPHGPISHPQKIPSKY